MIYSTAFGAPRNVNSTPLSDSLTLSWNEPDTGGGARRIRDYNVKWESGAFNGEFQVTDTSAQINDLQPNTRYNVNVSVITNRNEKGFPATLDVTTRKSILLIIQTEICRGYLTKTFYTGGGIYRTPKPETMKA